MRPRQIEWSTRTVPSEFRTAQGAAFGYLKPPGGWVNTSNPNAQVIASDGAAKDGFGGSIALSRVVCVVGAPGHGGSLQGAAYIFGEQ